jgi:hypothetical protein
MSAQRSAGKANLIAVSASTAVRVKQSDNAGGPGCQNGKAVCCEESFPLSPGRLIEATTNPAFAKACTVSSCCPNQPPRPWGTITSGNFVPVTGQSFAPSIDSMNWTVSLPRGHSLRRRCARVPYSAGQTWIGIQKLNTSSLHRRDQAAEYSGIDPTQSDHQCPHSPANYRITLGRTVLRGRVGCRYRAKACRSAPS